MRFLFIHAVDERSRVFRAVDSRSFGCEFESLVAVLDWVEQNEAHVSWPQNWPILTSEVLSPSSERVARDSSAMKDWIEVYEVPDNQADIMSGSVAEIEAARNQLELVALAGAIARKPSLRVIR